MSGKKRKRPGRTPPAKTDVEGFTFGPLHFERVGRLTRIRANWRPGEFEEFKGRVRELRPRWFREINDKVRALTAEFQQYDLVQLLTLVALPNVLGDPEAYRETTDTRRESDVEFALSLAAAREWTGTAEPSVQDGKRVGAMVRDVIHHVLEYFGSEIVENRHSDEEAEWRFQSLSRFLLVRGDSIAEHHEDLIRELFEEHDGRFQATYGFRIADFLVSRV